MKKLISFILGSLFALNLSISAANAAANEVRVAYFLEWPSPNLEDMQKKNFAKALGVPVKWTNFTNGGAMTDAMLAGDIDISYSQGLVPFINAVKSNAPLKLVDIAMEYGIPANVIEFTPEKVETYRKQGYPITDRLIKSASKYTLPKIDNMVPVPNAKSYDEIKENFYKLIKSLEPGITEIYFHPSIETNGLKKITNSWLRT